MVWGVGRVLRHGPAAKRALLFTSLIAFALGVYFLCRRIDSQLLIAMVLLVLILRSVVSIVLTVAFRLAKPNSAEVEKVEGNDAME